MCGNSQLEELESKPRLELLGRVVWRRLSKVCKEFNKTCRKGQTKVKISDLEHRSIKHMQLPANGLEKVKDFLDNVSVGSRFLNFNLSVRLVCDSSHINTVNED